VPATPETRRAYRDLLVTTPELAESVSGVILCDETLRQSVADGTPFPRACAARGILPGIKVDTGAKPLAGRPGETVTEGLDGLRERLEEYAGMGARFAKWRAVVTIADGLPTRACLVANAHALGRYAALCQEAGIVPISRARGGDGRRPRHRALRRSPQTRCTPSSPSWSSRASPSRASCSSRT
jgi:fructose-bisphosphate aldolase class I